jgi:hypothetical protein
MGWTTKETRFDLRKVASYFLFSKASVPAQVPTQYYIQFAQVLSPGRQTTGLQTWSLTYSLSTSSDFKNEWNCTHKPSSLSHNFKARTGAIFWKIFTSFFRRFILSITSFLGHRLSFSTGVHKFYKNLGAITKFWASDRWYKTSIILKTHKYQASQYRFFFFFYLARWVCSPLFSSFEN